MSDLKLYKMNDKSDDFTIDHKVFKLPFRLVLIGRSGAGKTSAIGTLLTLNQFFNKQFRGDNIYIFSPMENDFKMRSIIKFKNVPPINIYKKYDDDLLNALLDKLIEEYKDRVESKKKPHHTIILLDDLSFSGDLRGGYYNAVSRLFCNASRKSLISVIMTSQYISHILPVCLSNITAGIFYNMNDRELDMLTDNYNYLEEEKGKSSKRRFKQLFRSVVKKQQDIFIVKFGKEGVEYLDKNFKKLKY